MGLDVWFADDIANALLAAEQASATTSAAIGNDVDDPETVRAFRQGFRAALATLAVAFGLEMTRMGPAGNRSSATGIAQAVSDFVLDEAR